MWRLPLLKARTKLESALSREAAFLYNNLLLVALCLTILWGVLFPIVTQLVKGETRTIGRPYYDFFLRAFGLPLLLLMGIGPLIAWRRTSVRALARTLAWPVAVALASRRRCSSSLGAGSSQPGLIAYTFSRVRARDDRGRARRAGRARPARCSSSSRATGAATAATSCTPRSCCSRSASRARARTAAPTERRLTPGQSMSIAGVHAHAPRRRAPTQIPNAIETRAVLDVERPAGSGTLTSGDNQYFNRPSRRARSASARTGCARRTST